MLPDGSEAKMWRDPSRRTMRLFSTKGKRFNDINSNLFAKAKPGKCGKKDTEELKEVYRFSEMSDEEEEKEPDDDIPYNPKNLPLD